MTANIRATSVALLNARLADAVDLAAQLKHAHWNIRGPHFIALHQMFDGLNAEVVLQADLMAERAADLGGVATGTLQHIVASTNLAPYPADAMTANAHLQALRVALTTYATLVRAAAQTADEAGDFGTADVFTEVSRAVDQQLWKIEAHFEPAPLPPLPRDGGRFDQLAWQSPKTIG